ncbi:Uncharacterised protein [Mycobacteroides abscessus subsp. massiliense]|nr:Uncharacterised protein [Mycobacteroides abscessus subsp. massiliense]
MHGQPQVGHQPGQQGPAALVDLQVHEPGIELHHMRGQPHEPQRIGSLQPQ